MPRELDYTADPGEPSRRALDSRPPHLSVSAEGGPQVRVTIRGRCIGGDSPVYIAGPCAIESRSQFELAARRLAAMGIGFVRGGAYKPRTSPYAFQGLGEEGLQIISEVARRHDLVTVT